MDTLKKVMDRSFKDLKVDKELVKKTSAFYNSLMMRDEDSIEFFGGPLWGVHPIYFTTSDANKWFDDILDVDDIGLKRDIHALSSIVTSRQVSSDIVNLKIGRASCRERV